MPLDTPRPVALPASNEIAITSSIYLTREEAGAYLNLPPRWLANNARRGPRYIKVGRHVRYSIAALDSFMSANERRS